MSWLSHPVRSHYGRRRRRSAVRSEESPYRVTTFENYTLDELMGELEARLLGKGMRDFLETHHFRREFPDMSNFRLGPNMFDQTALDWIVLLTPESNERDAELIAQGIATRIRWGGDPATLPRGWTGVLRQSYEESMLRADRPTTLVGLLIYAEERFREHGWAARTTEEMKRLAREEGLRDFIIPLRLPTRYERENAVMPFEAFALRTRDDGQYRDHWLRMHVRLGAEVIGFSAVSHQHALHPDDLKAQVEVPPIEGSGEYLVKWQGEYYNVFVDLEHESAVMNQGCVWVRHTL